MRHKTSKEDMGHETWANKFMLTQRKKEESDTPKLQINKIK